MSNYFDSPATFTVCGRGRFPIDMLRHDVATPADAESVEAIEHSLHLMTRNVRLNVSKFRYITPDRWWSFGWIVRDELTVVDGWRDNSNYECDACGSTCNCVDPK